MFIKVCGLKTELDVAVAAEAGADAVGFVLSNSSARSVPPERIAQLTRQVPQGVRSVLVVNDLELGEALRQASATGVDVLQLHGAKYGRRAVEETSRRGLEVWRATSVAHGTDLRVGAWGEKVLLLDSPVPGSGERWDLASLGALPTGHWLLAGGLNACNVADAIRAARPWGVDVSSGVEVTRGVKNHGLIREFIAAARSAAG